MPAPRESFVLDGNLVCRLRKTAGLTQEALAGKAGISAKKIGDIESERGSVYRQTADAVAKALGIGTRTLVRVNNRTWHFAPRLEGHEDVEKLVEDAIEADMQGSHVDAARTMQRVLQAIRFDSMPLEYTMLFVKFVSFLDNSGRHGLALRRIDAFLARHREAIEAADASLIDWLTYHAGIAKRRLGRLDEARALFEKLWERVTCGDAKTSLLHQLGVVDLLLAECGGDDGAELLGRARSRFERSLEEWAKIGPTHRLGFSLLHLGQVLARQGDLEGAMRCFHRALQVFARFGCVRYCELTLGHIERDVYARHPFPARASGDSRASWEPILVRLFAPPSEPERTRRRKNERARRLPGKARPPRVR